MMLSDQTTLTTIQCMSQTKISSTPITRSRHQRQWAMISLTKSITELLRRQIKMMVGEGQNIQPTRSMRINSPLNSTRSQRRQTRQQRGEQQPKLILTVFGHTRVDCIKVSKMVNQMNFLMMVMASTNNAEPSWEDRNAKEADSTQLVIPRPPKRVGREKGQSHSQTLHHQIRMEILIWWCSILIWWCSILIWWCSILIWWCSIWWFPQI